MFEILEKKLTNTQEEKKHIRRFPGSRNSQNSFGKPELVRNLAENMFSCHVERSFLRKFCSPPPLMPLAIENHTRDPFCSAALVPTI